jgi:hypothetical protein
VIFVQPNGGVVLGCGLGVEPLIADLHDGSVADPATLVHDNSIGATVPPGIGTSPWAEADLRSWVADVRD